MKYDLIFKEFIQYIDENLKRVLPPEEQHPSLLHQAMHYAVFSGGKRFRPVLTLASCEAAGGNVEAGLYPAMAIELIHCYSLVHDDLPALDNDDMRRGMPSVHAKYGESTAILAGDGLLTLAFHLLAKVQPPRTACKLLEEISTAAGTYGMIGGQVADLNTRKEDLNLPQLDYISTHKTGKLIRTSLVSGAIAAEASRDMMQRLSKCGELMGLAYQTIDDLLDGDGYSRVMKPKDIREKARDLIANSKRELRPMGRRSDKLVMILDYLQQRMPKQTRRTAKVK